MTCKGIFFKAKASSCFSVKENRKDSYTWTESKISYFLNLNLQKRLSCPGCPECDRLYYLLRRDDFSAINFSKIKSEKLYGLGEKDGKLTLMEVINYENNKSSS